MHDQEKTPVASGGDSQKPDIFTDRIAESEQSGKMNPATFEDQEIATMLTVAPPAVEVPVTTKMKWHQALADQAEKMVYFTKTKGVALAPVAAGQIMQTIAPIEWLGDHMMIYVPELGHWAPSQHLLNQVLTEFVPTLKPTFGIPQAQQILDHAGVLAPSYILRDQPNRAEMDFKTWDAQPLITFTNGDLHVPSMVLRPHQPDHHTTWHVPFAWDAHATSAKLDKFLKTAIPDTISRKNLLAFVGYSLSRFDTSQHQFMYLLGSGRNGKSLLLKLIARALGPYWSNTNLKKLVDSRFAASSLVFSVLNLVGDQDAIFLATTELLKELSGFDAVDVERKFRDSFPFIAKTKFMFAVNGLPRTSDISFGFFRRPLIVAFPQRFAQDPNYEQSLLSDDEAVQALVVRALQAYREMVQHRGFWVEGKAETLLSDYRSDNDVVYAAVHEGLIIADEHHRIEPWALTPLINLYAAERENQKLSQSEILKRLNHAGVTVTKVRETHGQRDWYLHGLSADPVQASRLIHRAATTNPDGTAMINMGTKRIAVDKLLEAWGISDPKATIHDPEIARAFINEKGGSTRL